MGAQAGAEPGRSFAPSQSRPAHGRNNSVAPHFFFPGPQFHVILRRRQALVMAPAVSLGQLQRRLVSSPTFQGTHKGLIKTETRAPLFR